MNIRISSAIAVLVLISIGAMPAAARIQRPAGCPPITWNSPSYDYNSPEDFARFRNIESNHRFDAQTEATHGIPHPSDLVFIIGYVPNHHRALNALVRLSLRQGRSELQDARMPVECWLIRATTFRPKDGAVWNIFGTYLAKIGAVDEAIEKLKKAEEFLPNEPLVAYNLGLLYADKGDHELALGYAKRAYKAGVDLPGLKNKLVRAGKWTD